MNVKFVDFGQNKIVAMALLCGCDYCPDGVGGVGRDATAKLLNLYSNAEILDRLRSWRDRSRKYTELEMLAMNDSFCANCGHRGKQFRHNKLGCGECRTQRFCVETPWK